MSALDFITLWRAEPFTPFRVFADDGRIIEVGSAQQIAASPDLRFFSIVISAGITETLAAGSIARCERRPGTPVHGAFAAGSAGASVPAATSAAPAMFPTQAPFPAPAPFPTPPHAPGAGATPVQFPPDVAAAIEYSNYITTERGSPQVGFLTTHTDGVRITSVAVRSVTGRPCFTTAGTRFSACGLEVFENGCTLYLDHPDDPALVQRMIIWPPENGTFDTFAEALPFEQLMKELSVRDRELQHAPREPAPPAAYWDKIKPRPRPRIERAQTFSRDEDADPCPVRVVFDTHTAGKDHEINSVRLETHRGREPVFDLSGTSWDCTVTPGEKITLELRHWPEGARALALEVDPITDTARIPDLNVVHPLAFVERTLRNFVLHDSWGLLRAALARGPVAQGQPDLVISIPGGAFLVELWPGPSREGTPFLHPRIVEVGGFREGRCLLDLRGTAWGACVGVGQDHHVLLRLVHEGERHRWALLGLALDVDLPARRVTCTLAPGSTSLAVLQKGAPDWFNPSVMADNLKQSLARGLSVPNAPAGG